MLSEEELYIMNVDALHDDLCRMGKSSDANFSEARGLKDCLTYDRNGIKFVVANGNGFSAFTFIIPRMKDPKEKVWKIRKGTPLPQGVRLVKDLRQDHQGHYMFSPASGHAVSKISWFACGTAIQPGLRSQTFPTGDDNMPHNPALKARLPEWNTVLDAMRFYSKHLEERRAALNSESDEYLVLGDELVRLDGLIPDLERQVKALAEQPATLVSQ
jgi:hypothetical protein